MIGTCVNTQPDSTGYFGYVCLCRAQLTGTLCESSKLI